MNTQDTHGRWPYAAAAAALPVSLGARKRPELRPLAALLLHQTEEWFWPGGFLPWINHEMLHSRRDEFPIDRRVGFAINGLGWGTSLAATLGPRGAPAVGLFYVSNVANVGMHVSWALRNRRYDPGLVTALATLTPSTVIGVRRLLRDPAVSRRSLGVGLAAGLLASAAFPVAMRRRMRGAARADAA